MTYALVFYANMYHEAPSGAPDERRQEEIDKVRQALRGLAGKKEDILEASDQLVSWSNSLYEGRDKDRTKHQRIIAERLGICERVRMHSIDA